ncbi:hypothetical protein T4E_5719 [Trichinella pseudospiralis]|uniref:Uncharacterized protein n=2 Tax=Trichinella pseudospiralis TaxID=6337 RepID=A0A0V0YMR1_TRIPS|nr:hypothetical protein T4E_5719 [Trichinella pseudospiralis]
MKSLIISSLELVISRLATMMIALPVSGCGQRRKRRTGAILVLISPAVGAVVGMIDGRHGRKRKKRTPRFVTAHRNDPRRYNFEKTSPLMCMIKFGPSHEGSPGCAIAAVYFGLMWNNVDNQ